MAAIALNGNTFGCALGMGAFENVGTAFSNAKKSSGLLCEALSSLKTTIEFATVAAKIDTSKEQAKKAQECETEKKSALTFAYKKLEAFISDVGIIDQRVSDKIDQCKEDFYNRYYYLKPECEKSIQEKWDDYWAEKWQSFKDFWGGVGEAITGVAKNVGNWCKEHKVAIVTAIAVIAIAVIAVMGFGVEILVVAAVASLISLIISVIDIVFLIFSGKDLGDFLRSKDLKVFGDIIDGISWGCDFVAIVFPMVAFIQQSAGFIAKYGIKKLLQSTKQAFVLSIKETWNKLFRSGWKNGLINAFKIFIFDFDDLKKANTALDIKNSQQWILEGEKLVPKLDSSNYDECVAALKMFGLDGLPADKFGNLDAVELNRMIFGGFYENGVIVDIPNFSRERGGKYAFKSRIGTKNFPQANNMLLTQYGTTLKDLEELLNCSLTWHEDLNLKTLMPLPSILHDGSKAQYTHTGGIRLFKFMFPRTTNLLDNIIRVEVPHAIEEIISCFKKLLSSY